jgi:hypothetical protein
MLLKSLKIIFLNSKEVNENNALCSTTDNPVEKNSKTGLFKLKAGYRD